MLNLKSRQLSPTRLLRIAYWLIPLFLLLAQGLYSVNTTHQIRYEELSESVRNPFWLTRRTIFDGVYSNIGWDIPVMLLYYFFGFSLHLTKWARLVLQAFSLFSLALLLKRWLGIKRSWLPLLVIGLSPTWLFFNTLQAQFGIDLQYLPICLYLLVTLDFSQGRLAATKTFLLWAIAMIAAMSYPTFLLYLPILGLIYLYKLKQVKQPTIVKVKPLLLAAASFFLPLLLGFAYVTNRHLLINDPQELNAGIFRGGGRWPPLERLFPTLLWGLKRTFIDLFVEGRSYYFEVLRVEFSHPLTALAAVIVLLTSLWLLKTKRWRNLTFLIWFLLISSLLAGNLSDWAQGIRRNTPALAAFYIIFCFVWAETTKKKNYFPVIIKGVVIACAGILLLHHLKVYKDNYLVTLPRKSPNREKSCFDIVPNAPAKSLQLLTDRAKATGKLEFTDIHGQAIDCRLVEVYAAVSANCYFNKLNCPQLMWFHPQKKITIPLSTSLWDTYYLAH